MQDFYCNRVFLHSGTSTFTQVQDLSTSPTSALLCYVQSLCTVRVLKPINNVLMWGNGRSVVCLQPLCVSGSELQHYSFRPRGKTAQTA